MFIFSEFANLITFSLLGLEQGSNLGTSVHFFFEDTSKIVVLLMVMIYIIGFIRAGFPIEKIRDFLAGKNRFLGYIFAAFIGAITPFCSCSSIPLFLGFTAARIPIGITMSFLITSPMVNEAAVMMLGGIVGWKLTAIYVGFGILAGVIGGFFFDIIGSSKWIIPISGTHETKCKCENDTLQKTQLTFQYRHSFAIEEMKTILRKIYLWVLIGIGIGATLHGYVPSSWIQNHLGSGDWWTVPLAVIVGIPTYANATGVIPVIGTLISKGLPVGTAFAFMLSTAAVSLPEFIMLKQVMKTRLLIIFAVFILIFFTLCGWILNLIY